VSAGLLVEVLLAFAALVIPGMGLCIATRVTLDRPFLTSLALAFGLGFGIVAALSLALALVGAIGGTALGLGWLVITTSAWAIAIRRGRIREHARSWWGNVRADPWTALGVVVTVVGAAIVRWMLDPLVNLAPTVLRYWADGLEIADAGRIPETTLQWGRVLPTAGSKIVLSAFDAAAATLLGRGPIEPLAELTLVVTIGLIVVTIAVFSELGMRRWAPMGALVLFFTPLDLEIDLQKNLAEDWGRLVAFAAVLAAILAFPRTSGTTEGRRASLVVAGVLLGMAAGTHLVAACVGIAALFALGAAVAFVSSAWRRSLASTAAVFGIAVIVGGGILVVAPGDLGFQGAVDQRAYADLRRDLSLPPTFDPTRFIAMNDLEPPTIRTDLGFTDVARQYADRLVGANAYQGGAGGRPAPWSVVGPTVVGLALALLLILRGPSDLRLVAVMNVLLAAGLFAVGVLFAFRYDVFALEYFGNRRLFAYAALPFVAIGVAGAEAVSRRLASGRLGERGASIVTFVGIVALAAVLIPTGAAPPIGKRTAQEALLERIGRQVPCEGRILATHRTLGTFQTIAGHAAVLEGMGPHVRPSVLRLAIEEILRAQDFFDDPEAGRAYLRARGVDAILLARGSPAYAFGGYRIARVPPDRLDRVPFLRRAFENEAGVVYRVTEPTPTRALPKVAGRPGFDCHQGRETRGG
jgi:hypothetical protein